MIRMSRVIKSVKVILLGENDEELELKLTAFTVSDFTRLMTLQKPVIESKVSDLEKLPRYAFARVMCALKYPDGSYYWAENDVIEALSSLPQDLVGALATECEKLNPITGEVKVEQVEGEETELQSKKK